MINNNELTNNREESVYCYEDGDGNLQRTLVFFANIPLICACHVD